MPSKLCEVCLVEVPQNKWVSHTRTIAHKRKSTVTCPGGVKVLKTCFKKRIETLFLENPDSFNLDCKKFLAHVKDIVVSALIDHLQKHTAIKYNMELFAEYVRKSGAEEEISIKSFQTKMEPILDSTEPRMVYEQMMEQILVKMEELQERNSGWALVAILHLEINVNKYQPIRGSSYISLPKKIRQKNACINVKNMDVFCFKWSIISALYPIHHSDRVSAYQIEDINSSVITLRNNKVLDFGVLQFPLQVSDVYRFEELNDDISVNVFGLEEEQIVGPYYCTKTEKPIHINLLLLQEDDKFHYVWIKNISRLLKVQITRHHDRIYMCNCCLSHFHKEDQLNLHRGECNRIVTTMPTPNRPHECQLQFTKHQRSIEVPFVIYADFECILQDVNTCSPQPSVSSTTDVQEHIPCAFSYYIVCSYDSSLNQIRVYKGQNSPKQFVLSLANDISNIYNSILMRPKAMQPLSDDEKDIHNNSGECHICNKELGSDRVADHCHLTGKYRGPAHNECNLLYRIPKFFPVFFHNFSGYDCHLFVKALNEIEGDIKLIPLNKELYVSLSKWIYVGEGESVELRFLDSARFMQSSLEKLAQNLAPSDFHCVKSIFTDEAQFKLVTRKGVLPYEYLNSFERLDETVLPPQIKFNNKMTNSECSDDEYEHAKIVWKVFNCENLWDYLKTYLITDVLLLADIFQNFRKLCYKIYSLDPAQYYTAPGLAWDAMLKYTGVKLELLTDITMFSFIKKGIRGGITQCSHRYSLANNKYMDGYDMTRPSAYLCYLDINNLYGWAMSQPLPYGGFKWVENADSINIMDIAETSDIGYIFEVDLEYPNALHAYHNDLPFCAENKRPPNSKLPKLIADLTLKTKYIIHYKNLQQCLGSGLKLLKVHRALQFNLSSWLKRYIDLNTYHRARAQNEFEKDYFKLKNNAVFGKTMENVDKRKDVRIVTAWESSGRRLGARALIAKPNFHSATQFTPDMVAIQLSRTKTYYNKPIYLGFVVLELSKWLMYDFHYAYMKPKYGDNLVLNYMDTDSFVYTIHTEDFYSDIRGDIASRFDTSGYDPNNQFNIPLVNKKQVGLMKDENNGYIMREFIGLRSKMYSIDVIDRKPVKKAKGVKKTVVDGLSLDS